MDLKVSASFLSSRDIGIDLKKLNFTDVDYIHVDYMDGKFVSSKSLSFRKLKKIYKYTSKRLDVHLMAVDVLPLIRKFASLNTEFITFHVELGKDIEAGLKLIHSYGLKAGLAIKPGTDISVLAPYLDFLDMILVMSVEPGKGGQSFLSFMEARLMDLKIFLLERGKGDIIVSVDGGINEETIHQVKEVVDVVVSGSYITESRNFQERIDILRGGLENHEKGY